MKKILTQLLVLSVPLLLAFHPALIKIDWSHLADVSFEDRYYEDFDQYLPYPTFGQSVKDLENKEVQISGYIIPIEPGTIHPVPKPFCLLFLLRRCGT